ncbi:hypothetical protein GCM10007385_35500 [Tateyamaria omphalii]|uniref:hypothetical protein n=1 Tax=Tateyamaria omphalii TaxID=299262 RepID=UPI001674DAB3|nr:hypothetical protein [Tateyamaria omphalii]GGX63267.1 hypothetical protein GCM10007385_35500 [Tateyamaria omphalii]
MTQSFAAQVRNWSEKAKRNAGLVVADAAQVKFKAMSRRQPSVKETGGSFEVGKVPVDEGVLINTMISSLNGSQVGEGENAYVAGLAGFEAGDSILFAFTAEYAQAIEYGTVNFPGRFMVREALNSNGGWQAQIDLSAAKFQD